jgi:hypothetical protein
MPARLLDERCVASLPSAAVDLAEVTLLSDDTRQLLWSWRRRADEARAQENAFEAFIFNWIYLNGWAERVTGLERDDQWVKALAISPQISERFVELQATKHFNQATRRFAALWPIFKASRQRELGIPFFEDRDQVVEWSLAAGIERRPQCYGAHPQGVPNDWAHTLHALYRVRCNLFHGEKGVHVDGDRRIVHAASDVLAEFLAESGIFDF